jgi:hypothetical protein
MTRMRRPSRRLGSFGGLAIVALALASLISIAVIWQSSFTIVPAAPRDADARFQQVRERFSGARPLLEIVRGNGRPTMLVHRERLPASRGSTRTIRGLAWRASDRSLAEVRLPFWFVRMKLAGGRVTLSAMLPDGWDIVRVSSDDLVRHGPGLLLDERAPAGDRLLLWAE